MFSCPIVVAINPQDNSNWLPNATCIFGVLQDKSVNKHVGTPSLVFCRLASPGKSDADNASNASRAESIDTFFL